jgi:acetylornithine deacetylase/succinyl-diaminopimelate desuccinylase-like protein
VDPPASPFDSEMFAAIRDAVRELDPALAVVPYLSTGATDSARLRALGVQAYGVLPFPLEQADEERMHGHDERVPLTSLEFGVRLVYGIVKRVAL